MFSIVVPAYNAEKCISRCINSILKQSYDKFEIIIVNDGSTDGTPEQIGRFSDERIRVIHQENAGPSAARNTGIRNAKYPFICFLDADDEYLENHLSVLHSAISQFSDKAFLVTFSYTELLNGNVIRQFDNNDDTNPFYVEDFLQYEFSNNMVKCFNTNSVCVKRTAFEKYGYFEEGVNICEDVDMWNRIMLFEGKVVIPQYTVLRHRDYSFLTKLPPIGSPFFFNNRIPGYLEDPSISAAKKEELIKLYNIMELASIRSLIIHGKKKEAFVRLKKIDKNRVSKKKYYETFVSFLIPAFVMKKMLLNRNKGYFKNA